MRSLEAVLTSLVDRVSPGDVRFNITRSAFMREFANYEMSVTTRSHDEVFNGKTIGEAVRSAIESLEQSTKMHGDVDLRLRPWCPQ
jgi:hypothetical protein